MAKLVSINPANNKILGEVGISAKQEIIDKVKEAKKALKVWKDLGLEERVKLLRVVGEKLLKNKEELAKLATSEMGMPISQSRADVDDAVSFLNWYLDNAKKYLSPEIIYEDESIVHKVFYEPVGVAAVITPWNFPLSNFVWAAGQSLISGNVAVYKTSEECPLFGQLLDEIIKSSGLPRGVFSVVYGDGKVGEILISQDVDLISFTGSSKVGKHLYNIAGQKFIKAVVELGGSAPGIVFPDADIDSAVENIYGNRFTNCGQMCDALKRLIVHEGIFDEVVNKLKIKLEKVVVGDPADPNTEIGPLVAKRQLDLLEAQVKDAIDKGAKIVIGGERLGNLKGAFYKPTILINVTSDMRVWQEEVFGPVLPVVSFSTTEEAIKLANDTKYGLGSYVYVEDKKIAKKISDEIESGMVSINSASYVRACSPFGGYKDSGMGREHGKFGFSEFTQVKVIASNK